MRSPLPIAALLAASLACARNDSAAPAPPPAAPPATPPAAASAAPPADAGLARGTVAEVLDTAGYTYVRVQAPDGKESWAATTQFQVEPGDVVVYSTAMAMENYRSTTLDRTFDVVYFSDAIQVVPPDGSTPSGLRQMAPPPTSLAPSAGSGSPHSSVPAGVDLAGIEKAPGGVTVEEVVAQAASLDGKEVAVRGRVVKFTGGVLGKNWLHLRDGSGGGEADVTVTTEGEAAVGDLVIVRGKVATNQDLGSGYSYPVLIQDATIDR